MLNYNAVLNNISSIRRKYESISKYSGEDFNIFKILKVQSAEVRLHSAFIGELLNPKGSHGQQNIFLQLFVSRFNIKQIDFQTKTAVVNIEKHTGFISEDRTRGGRIDILITDENKNQFIIENKIYASDQENQLLRYYNHNPKANLLYLSLFGGEVSKISSGNLNESYFNVISYEKDIIAWLIDCRKEAIEHPTLRECITQYLNLLRSLTGQSTNNLMKKEIIETLIYSEEKLSAAFDIANNLDAVCDNLLLRLQEITFEIAIELNLESSFEIDFNKKFHGFFFWKKEWQKSSISFHFENRDKELIYGIIRDDECLDLSDQLTQDVQSATSLAFSSEFSSWWPSYRYMDEPFLNWTDANKEPWLAIVNGSIKILIKEKVLEILLALEEVKGL